jgi:molybdopterin-guanine dinucleotide biosynthesis protein A
MGGIYSAMRGLEEDAFFVCACDMPLMSRGYIEALLAFWRERSEKEVWDGLMVRNRQGRIYTTAGIYHRRMLPVLEEKIRQGNYRMMAFLRECRVGYLEEESLGEQSRALTNINTVEDYEKLPDPHKG